jgi:hypothetical protein
LKAETANHSKPVLVVLLLNYSSPDAHVVGG